MKKIILLRHGQSTWNEENRFTGWTDVGLTEQGEKEAHRAGELLCSEKIHLDIAYTSKLKRAINTLNIVLEEMEQEWVEVKKSWRLNEKHYGMLQGLNKSETAQKYGEKQVKMWRRSFDLAPDPVAEEDARNPKYEVRYRDVPHQYLPRTESLKDTIERMMPYWQCEIFPQLKHSENILIAAHGNSLRALIMHLKGFTEEEIVEINLPTGVPYIFEFDQELQLVRDYFLGNSHEIEALMREVANQGKA